MASPEINGRIGTRTQNHVEVGACLQITRNRWDTREVVEGTRWWNRTIIEEKWGDNLTPLVAEVRGNNHGLRVFGMDGEICNSGVDLTKSSGRVRDCPTLGSGSAKTLDEQLKTGPYVPILRFVGKSSL